MSELAIKRMTVAELLRWEDGTDTRYELLGGSPVAMAPPAIAHGILALRLGARIDAALRSRPPCFGQSEAGIVRPDRDDTCYVADLAVSCSPPERGQQLLQDPLLIVEILSPGTAMYDRQTKVADYRRIPSVEEILLIDLGEHLCRGIAARRRPLDHRDCPWPASDLVADLDRASRNHGRPVRGDRPARPGRADTLSASLGPTTRLVSVHKP